MTHDNMDGDIAKLIALLKKILKKHPAGSELTNLMDQKAFNLNLCFLTIVPMVPEDLEDLEDLYDEFLKNSDEGFPKKKDPKLEFKLSREDVKFLKQHGIRFN